MKNEKGTCSAIPRGSRASRFLRLDNKMDGHFLPVFDEDSQNG